jgi:hypothetical protein
MADERELWSRRGKEIVRDPDNDEFRYSFASELEDGEAEDSPSRARAQFVRVQLKLNQLRPSHPEYMRLATSAYALEVRYRLGWIPPFFQKLDGLRVEFHRGFVELVQIAASSLREHQNRLFEEAPIQHLDIVKLESADRLQRLLESLDKAGQLEKLVSLGLDGQNLSDESIEVLQNTPFKRLQWLSLAHNKIGQKGFAMLVEGKFRRLKFVDLHDNPFDPTPKLVYDQGVVIEKVTGPHTRDHEDIPWLKKTIRGCQYIPPGRFLTFNT